MAVDGPLNVVALVSGGKDSFYSILHCLANGHRVLALANLHPPTRIAASGAEAHNAPGSGGQAVTSTGTIRISPGEMVSNQQHDVPLESRRLDSGGIEDEEDETDLNSFMYQTVGHQVIPLYAQATGLPLFRQPILGTAVDHGISYQDPDDHTSQAEEDETESLVPLLRAVLEAHPEVNALCTGAILSTYQRTRVESVALRLGLVPLSYLWQFPELPLPSITPQVGNGKDDAQLLRDMEAAGLEARIVKVASAGLDEEFLWENVASEVGVVRIRRALRRYGGGSRGSVLGEGGEFETLVVDGPPSLFRGRILVRDDDKKVVHEGGGSAWLGIRKATVEMKQKETMQERGDKFNVRIPNLLDARFEEVLESLNASEEDLGIDYTKLSQTSPSPPLNLSRFKIVDSSKTSQDWYFEGKGSDAERASTTDSGTNLETQVSQIVDEIRQRLQEESLPTTAITNSIIMLQSMDDFPKVNKLYGALFREPNPPARVTIQTSHLSFARLAVILTVQPRMKREERRGLHVQSRSYWAPANIGPYSQAIAYPLLTNKTQSSNDGVASDSPLGVSIAGQIPLMPASMTLPSETPYPGSDVELQLVLALQHLWRVGAEMKVQWWSSAVAYFERSKTEFGSRRVDLEHKAFLTAAAWRAAHYGHLTDTEEEDHGPDLWDQKYNPLYMTYGDGGDTSAARPSLPDWEALRGLDTDTSDAEEIQKRPLPFVFIAEADVLPRDAKVEWHAHLGFANVSTGSVKLHTIPAESIRDPELHHTLVESPTGDIFAQSIAVYRESEDMYRLSKGGTDITFFKEAVNRAAAAVKKSIATLLMGAAGGSQFEIEGSAALRAKMIYISDWAYGLFARTGDTSYDLPFFQEKGPMMGLRTMWDSMGRPLYMVSIYETRWARVK
ncbi:adenine nucleotide alpha hydrolases-like protein [Hypoxylon fuscum]|nr:adenine nucleotide alpha hydrolases-like protein [Hypoxylon fuscum]